MEEGRSKIQGFKPNLSGTQHTRKSPPMVAAAMMVGFIEQPIEALDLYPTAEQCTADTTIACSSAMQDRAGVRGE
jgi:hypothetical protein